MVPMTGQRKMGYRYRRSAMHRIHECDAQRSNEIADSGASSIAA